MKEIFLLVVVLISLLLISCSVYAFGQIAGPVVIHVPLGGSNASSWGILNNEATTVKISAEGDATKFISFPERVTLEPDKIYLVNITAKIPSDYDLEQGKNITGTLYALLEGKPGQVQINLQLKKNMYILVEEPKKDQSTTKFMTGLFLLGPNYAVSISVLVVLFTFILFFKNKRR
jgi:hypothetical protein